MNSTQNSIRLILHEEKDDKDEAEVFWFVIGLICFSQPTLASQKIDAKITRQIKQIKGRKSFSNCLCLSAQRKCFYLSFHWKNLFVAKQTPTYMPTQLK